MFLSDVADFYHNFDLTVWANVLLVFLYLLIKKPARLVYLLLSTAFSVITSFALNRVFFLIRFFRGQFCSQCIPRRDRHVDCLGNRAEG